MGSPMSNMLLNQTPAGQMSDEELARQAAMLQQQQEAARMASLAAGGQLAPPTQAVQDINSAVAAQPQPQTGAIASLLARVLGGGAQQAPAPAPTPGTGVPIDQALNDEAERRRRLQGLGMTQVVK